MPEFVLLRRGDTMPAVSVAQLLLNRTGASLTADLIFGSRTQQEVREFQRPRSLAPDGVIGQRTWPRFEGNERRQIIDRIDVIDQSLCEMEVRDQQRFVSGLKR